jgi:hypothetical protein
VAKSKTMSVKSIATKLFAKKYIKTQAWASNLLIVKKCFLNSLIKEAKRQFGIDHHFDQIKHLKILQNTFHSDYED